MRANIIVVSGLSLLACFAGEFNGKQPNYKVLPPIAQGNLTVFPVVADKSFDTGQFLTLDEGIRSGQVIVTELGQPSGLVRPRQYNNDGVWRERPFPAPQSGARVNQLALINSSDRPLLLLAGEIVTGGKQDRVVGKDRIIPAHSEPVALDVFCVEPHRWIGASAQFGATASAMVQPSVRSQAMAERNQQGVWDEVAKSRAAFAATVPAPQALAIQSSSSYAAAVQNGDVKTHLDSMAAPIERSYEKLMQRLEAEKAVGAVVAVNGEIIWADVFASPALLAKYWPKLVRSYAAEALAPRPSPGFFGGSPSQENAQKFLDQLYGSHQTVETEPGIYSNTEIQDDYFDVFVLTSLLPNTGFQVHIAKMKRWGRTEFTNNLHRGTVPPIRTSASRLSPLSHAHIAIA